MKRGFLNKPPSRGVAQERKPDASRTIAQTKPQASDAKTPMTQPVTVPQIVNVEPDVPMRGNFPTSESLIHMNLVTLPYPSPFSQDLAAICALYPGTKEALLALPGFPAPVPHRFASPFHLPYYVNNVPGMGKSVVAATSLKPGDVILCERPLLIMPVYMPKQALPGGECVDIIYKCVKQSRRYDLHCLHNCKGPDVSRLAGVLDTNMLDIGGLPGSYDGGHGAVCMDLSRINHSCTPNSEHTWDLKSMTYTVRAIRPIAKGEQIYITYLDVFAPRAERQKELLRKYSFKCMCTSCTLPQTDSTRSDVRRSLIKTMIKQNREVLREQDRSLKQWAMNASLPDDHLIKRSQMLLDLMEEEGVYDRNAWFAHCTLVFKVLSALGNREAVVKLANKAATITKIYTGSDGVWAEIIKAPEATEWWGLRKKNATRRN